ncbi:hypothetical protein [Nostoc sp. CMAA1605]|uniref:hypothetical protein n=1 Tax=Nostoc sp. CMAA1605 TaxID=2055159 RepID=UPI001F1E5DA4|nr:hypothetical protein [Nostoc sp. CMAA1605]MCF4970251.1 hypothetical protein [Nostoc sp. CMAA1605]
MAINSRKWLSIPLLATFLAFFLSMPSIALAAPLKLYPAVQIANSVSNVITDYPNWSGLDLTPMERQQLQGMMQRRNQDIAAILNLFQRQELQHQLHSGHNFHQALQALNLQPEQENLIKAIEQLTSLKIKAALARYALIH